MNGFRSCAAASPAGSVSLNMLSPRETNGFHIPPQRFRRASNGLTKTVQTYSVASALVVRIHERAAPDNPCPESFRLSRPFRLSGFGLRHEHDDTILDERDLAIPRT